MTPVVRSLLPCHERNYGFLARLVSNVNSLRIINGNLQVRRTPEREELSETGLKL